MTSLIHDPSSLEQPHRLRIVHCFRSPVGGIFRHVRDLAEAQVADGHAVGIVCDSSTGGEHEERLFRQVADRLELGVNRTPMQRHIGLGDLGAAWRTYSLIKKLRPDVLHGHGAKGGVYSRVFGSLFRASRSRVARVYSPHGGSLHYDERTATGRLLFALEGGMGRMTDAILFVSEHEHRAYERKIGRPHCEWRVILNGLRAEEFAPVTEDVDAADFIYVGMMRDLKGPDLFIQALKTIAASTGRKISAVMVGEGADLPRYRDMAAAASSVSIRFIPPMPARQAFAMGRVLVVPSRAEAMPYIVLEALAAGRALVATAVGGIPEILGAGSPALAEPDAGSLAERMENALSDPAGFARLMPPITELQAGFSATHMAREVDAAYAAARA